MNLEPALPNWHPQPYSIPQELAGTVSTIPNCDVIAGSWTSFQIIYQAGRFGIDDSGSIKICFRFASDQTKLQLDDPQAPGFVTVIASNGATLNARFDHKQNVRPYDRTLHIKVVRGFLQEGDTITATLGDTQQGSPGLRVQTFTESHFSFRVLADPIACYQFVPVLEQPTISVIAGPRAKWSAVAPSVIDVNKPFSVGIRSEDAWGNPSGNGPIEIVLSSKNHLEGLPDLLSIESGTGAIKINDIRATVSGTFSIEIYDTKGKLLCSTNPICCVEKSTKRLYWADFHAQSGETIGTNSAAEYFRFARDTAFLDIVGHQGNDFQITKEFWDGLNQLSHEFNCDDLFITLPGYEWSGNTPLGGDRNVFFMQEGRPIRRSSHALIPSHEDLDTDCHTANDLFQALHKHNEDAVVFAHVGGRYADIKMAHDPSFETAVEVHSSWGTFEWLINDAFSLGYRVGIVANSDGHKGRPGAESPGASMFGAYGGLTALPLNRLTRTDVFDALRKRHHYATTGSRMIMEVNAFFDSEITIFEKDPVLGIGATQKAQSAEMGDIVYAPQATQTSLSVRIASPSPIERIEIRRGQKTEIVYRPYSEQELGKRLRVIWSGAEYRGRFRMTPWDGHASIDGNKFLTSKAINFLNLDRPLSSDEKGTLHWQSVTTGNHAGFEVSLANENEGILKIETKQGNITVNVNDIGINPIEWDFGGLARKLSVQRMPDTNPYYDVSVDFPISLSPDIDNPLYISVVTEDGHQAWSSPIYVVAKPTWLE